MLSIMIRTEKFWKCLLNKPWIFVSILCGVTFFLLGFNNGFDKGAIYKQDEDIIKGAVVCRYKKVMEGSRTWDVDMNIKPYCPEGEIIYPRVTLTTNWKTGVQTATYSWQCYVDSLTNDRVYVYLGTVEK